MANLLHRFQKFMVADDPRDSFWPVIVVSLSFGGLFIAWYLFLKRFG